MTIILGATYTDQITGYSGVAVGHVEYLTDCHQTLLQARAPDSHTRPQAEWFDDQRLERNNAVIPSRFDNSATPGSDRQAPRR